MHAFTHLRYACVTEQVVAAVCCRHPGERDPHATNGTNSVAMGAMLEGGGELVVGGVVSRMSHKDAVCSRCGDDVRSRVASPARRGRCGCGS